MLVLPQNKALALKLNNPERVLASIPTAQRLTIRGQEIVVTPHGVNEVAQLNALGIGAPSPILYHYEWPGRYKPYDHQRETAAFLTTTKKGLVLNEIGCVDADTEYLSPTGWRRIADYSGGAVAQYWPETGKIDYVDDPQFVKLPCKDMIRFKTAYGVDQLLSPEHRVLYVSSTGKRMVRSAEQILARHLASDRGWSGRIITTFATSGGAGTGLTEAQLRLQVAVMADGHFGSDTKRCVMRLKKLRKKERLRMLLQDASVSYTERACASAVGFSVFTFEAPLHEKTYAPWAWTANQEELEVIASEVLEWDGSYRKAGAGAFFSRDKASADFVQYAFAATGRTASLTASVRGDATDYVVHAREGAALLYVKGYGANGRTDTIYREPSTDGFKYCFMVPSTFLILRRNGCIFATGNTGKTQSALWAADYLMSIGAVEKTLIISPLSTLERVWGDAVYMNFTHRRASVLHGTADRRRRLLKQNADFYVVNHDGFPIIAQEAMGMFDLVIVDEAAVLRNPTTKRFKSFRKWMDANPATRLWLMTGTPTPNEPTDAWALAKLIDSPYCTKTYTNFRDQVMNKISMYKYIPRPDSADIVKHILQPSVRYTRDECFDLPDTVVQTREVDLTPEQAKHYQQMMKHLITETGGSDGTITAVNEAVKMMKLVQIACISKGTDVLCKRGWVPIEQVSASDLVWDGCEWVAQGGAIYRGTKPTVLLAGVRMTADHKVLTTKGWVQAQDIINAQPCSGFERQAVRLPHSYKTRWDITKQMRAMGMYLRLRGYGGAREPVLAYPIQDTAAQLRMQTWQSNTRHDQYKSVSYMGAYEAAVSGPKLQGLPQLGRARHNSLPGMVGQLRSVLGRYATWLRGRAFAWPHRQQRELHARELPVGNSKATSGQSAEAVYDLINCGPRNRFVVRGMFGELTIVHNCGVAYGEDGNDIELDCSPRVKAVEEVIEEAGAKVIVFVPLTGTLRMLERELSRRWTVAVVNGSVSSTQRDEIFYNFQHTANPHVLIAHPATMAHGLTLTAASTVIWYGPIASNEQYQQANGRVERIGKRHVSNVVHIQSTKLEQKIFERLAGKQKMQGLLLDMIQQEMHR